MTNNVPNLDCMPLEDLVAFAAIYEGKATRNAAYHLVGMRPRAVRVATDLGNYARNKSVAMQCRARGDIMGASMYESICDRIYEGLPQDVRW